MVSQKNNPEIQKNAEPQEDGVLVRYLVVPILQYTIDALRGATMLVNSFHAAVEASPLNAAFQENRMLGRFGKAAQASLPAFNSAVIIIGTFEGVLMAEGYLKPSRSMILSMTYAGALLAARVAKAAHRPTAQPGQSISNHPEP